MPAGFTTPDPIDPAETAVLFIDLQSCWASSRSKAALPYIDAFSQQVAGMGVQSYWIGHKIGPAFHVPRAIDTGVVQELDQLDPDQRYLFDMNRKRGYIVEKSEPGAFTNPHLFEHLQWSGVKTVFGCGFIAGQCVATTLIGAREAGFKVGLIADLSVDNLKNGTMCNLSRWWVRKHQVPRVRSQSVLKALEAGRPQPIRQFSLAKPVADGLTP